MTNEGHTNTRELRIQGLLDLYLEANSRPNDAADGHSHLDEDSISAFVEGSFTEKEAQPIVSHLADCGYCRHRSAELIKLDLQFADEPTAQTTAEPEPTKVAEVLGGILNRIFGSNEGAVFAHNESEDKDEEDSEDPKE